MPLGRPGPAAVVARLGLPLVAACHAVLTSMRASTLCQAVSPAAAAQRGRSCARPRTRKVVVVAGERCQVLGCTRSERERERAGRWRLRRTRTTQLNAA